MEKKRKKEIFWVENEKSLFFCLRTLVHFYLTFWSHILFNIRMERVLNEYLSRDLARIRSNHFRVSAALKGF